MKKTQTKMTFKDRLVEELKYHDIPYKVFAVKVGISISTFNMYLYRNSIPLADVAVRMAKVLNTTTEYLITGETPSNLNDDAPPQKQEILNIVNGFSKKELSCFLKIANAFKDVLKEK